MVTYRQVWILYHVWGSFDGTDVTKRATKVPKRSKRSFAEQRTDGTVLGGYNEWMNVELPFLFLQEKYANGTCACMAFMMPISWWPFSLVFVLKKQLSAKIVGCIQCSMKLSCETTFVGQGGKVGRLCSWMSRLCDFPNIFDNLDEKSWKCHNCDKRQRGMVDIWVASHLHHEIGPIRKPYVKQDVRSYIGVWFVHHPMNRTRSYKNPLFAMWFGFRQETWRANFRPINKVLNDGKSSSITIMLWFIFLGRSEHGDECFGFFAITKLRSLQYYLVSLIS